jgi:hypothetical protein
MILREPLVHFLAAGALIFVAYAFFGDRDDAASRRIVVDAPRIDSLAALFAAQWQRPPTADEIGGLIEQHIEEEVLYREAMALGLDESDTIVRRRLAQKMQFVIEDTARPPVPSEQDLRVYFQEHLQDFATPPQLSFTHVYFSTDRRSDAVEAAQRMLAQIGDADRAPQGGDPFMLRYEYADVSRDDIARLFGAEFADRVFELPEGAWQGPVRSSYGVHLVRIINKTVPAAPQFADVEAQVREKWLDAARRRANVDTLVNIKSRYEIVIAPRVH